MNGTNWNENKIHRQNALKQLERCKELEAQKIAKGARYQRIDGKTLALKH